MCVFNKPNRDLTKDSVVNTTTTAFTTAFTDTLFSLLVLLTTTNHPDILIPPYNGNRGTAIFSIVYLGVGLYVLLNILTAAVYSQFSGYLMVSKSNINYRILIVEYYFIHGMELVSSDDIVGLIKTVHIDTWKKDTLRQVSMRHAHGNINAKQFMQLFQILDLSGSSNQIMAHSLELGFCTTPTSARALWLMPLTKHHSFSFVILPTNKLVIINVC
ncbi:unnamed protein product [Schistosoma rodhaini]|uniref:Ion transport domain-containing protein n=1 Tax=Schistosoma rodhaini TaxID=6188 RepID=A0AA85EK26_9TREM|nr:unnamed protein product [Schistosoma rodhaini]